MAITGTATVVINIHIIFTRDKHRIIGSQCLKARRAYAIIIHLKRPALLANSSGGEIYIQSTIRAWCIRLAKLTR